MKDTFPYVGGYIQIFKIPEQVKVDDRIIEVDETRADKHVRVYGIERTNGEWFCEACAQYCDWLSKCECCIEANNA